MRALLIPCLACCSLAISGCRAVYSVHSLNTSEDAVEMPALTGHWVSNNNDGDHLCIVKGDQNTYTMIVADDDSKQENEANTTEDSNARKEPKLLELYRITLVRLDDQLFADVVPAGQLLDNTAVDAQAGTVDHHNIVKLNLSEDDMTFSLLDDSAIREAKEQGLIPLSYVDINDGLLLISSTEDLRWSVSHYADQLFGEASSYRRATEIEEENSSPLPCGTLPKS